MNKKRQLAELTLWLAALIAAVLLTGSDGWQKSPARWGQSGPGVQSTLLR